ncbi:hypothetical protein RV14_GL000703 [Enterococcus ratti]|uniref:Uncharacterized protein n=1 Tax=Enterococcus ratti TaxID=150033 RepID=A0A1L8WG95_9ENTE|nr:hypothetical protein RV14_GL000703 [Enterococcus ratti]
MNEKILLVLMMIKTIFFEITPYYLKILVFLNEQKFEYG